MIVFKTFLKILKKNKFIIILYTGILLTIAIGNLSTLKSGNMSFTESKPDILIINKDKKNIITDNLVNYIKKNSNIIKVKDTEEARDDAIFYQDVDYIIYIPNNYSIDFMNGNNPKIKIKKTHNYNSSYSEMILKRYLNTANTYQKSIKDEKILVEKINETLDQKTKVKITSKLDQTALEKSTYYFNFISYSILACLIYIISLILSSFNSEKIRKRINISSISYKKNNRILFISNILFSLCIWILYLGIGYLFCSDVIFTSHGLIYIINSLIFTICVTSMAFLIGNLLSNRDAINGIMNVIALGSSFLCGVFVPLEWIPDSVKVVAHIIPTYYYVTINNKVSSLEIINLETLKPLIINMIILVIFTIIFIILTNIVTKKNRKI